MATVIEARVKQKTGTLPEWMDNTIVLLNGEQAFVRGLDNEPMSFRIGDGARTFAELPAWEKGYSKNETNAFFAGTVAMAGYNKSNWDNVNNGSTLNNNISGKSTDTLATVTGRSSTTNTSITANGLFSNRLTSSSGSLFLATSSGDKVTLFENGDLELNGSIKSLGGLRINNITEVGIFNVDEGFLGNMDIGQVMNIGGTDRLNLMTFSGSWAVRATIFNNGNIAIGYTTNSGDKLNVNGKVKATNIEATNELRVPITTSAGVPTGSTAVLSITL